MKPTGLRRLSTTLVLMGFQSAVAAPVYSIKPIVLDGDSALGTGSRFSILGVPSINSSGQLAFGALLSAPVNAQSLWVATTRNAVNIRARAGDPAQGTNSSFLELFQRGSPITTPIGLNDVGQITFSAAIVGGNAIPANDTGLWKTTPEGLRLVAREGDPPAGLVSLDDLSFSRPLLDSTGQVAFRSSFVALGIRGDGVFAERGGALAPIVSSGIAAPGTGGGVFDRPLTRFDLNTAGRIAFPAFVQGATERFDSVWKQGNAGLQIVVREGDTSGVPPNTFQFFSQVAMNSTGDVAFEADHGSVDTVWKQTANGQLLRVMAGGLAAPGTDGQFLRYAGTNIDFNSARAVLVDAFYFDASGRSQEGLWVGGSYDDLSLVVRTGGTLNLGGQLGDVRVRELDVAPGLALNDAGQVAFWARYDGGQGIFLAYPVSEPTTSVLSSLALLCLLIVGGQFHRAHQHLAQEMRRHPPRCRNAASAAGSASIGRISALLVPWGMHKRSPTTGGWPSETAHRQHHEHVDDAEYNSGGKRRNGLS